MPLPNLTIQAGDITEVTILDEKLVDEDMIQQAGLQVMGLVETASVPKILIDFAAVAHLSSSALGTLIKINNAIRKKDGQLCLCNISDEIYEAFVITKLNQLFRICKTHDEALASFN